MTLHFRQWPLVEVALVALFTSSAVTGQIIAPPPVEDSRGPLPISAVQPRSRFTDLPLATNDPRDLLALRGPEKVIPGERVVWSYPFVWTARAADGASIPLERGAVMQVAAAAPSGWVVNINGAEATIAVPPNVGVRNVFSLAETPIKGATLASVINRLGRPNKMVANKDGGAGLLYAKKVVRTRTAFDVTESTTVGSVGSNSFSANTRSTTPRRESLTYFAYAFVVRLNPDKIVDRVDDLKPRAAPEWKRE